MEKTPETDLFIGIDPTTMSPPEVYRLLLHHVAPRPIAFVSTLSKEGIPNLAPFSFFMAGGSNPPSVVVSPTNSRHGLPKDTLVNIRDTGEYTISVVSYFMAERMNQASAEYPYGVSEWEKAGFYPAPSVRVRPARVSESLMAMECRLFQIVEHGGGPLSANYIIGEVVYFHVARAILQESGQIDATLVDYIGRMGGDLYVRARPDAMFAMPRPPRPTEE